MTETQASEVLEWLAGVHAIGLALLAVASLVLGVMAVVLLWKGSRHRLMVWLVVACLAGGLTAEGQNNTTPPAEVWTGNGKHWTFESMNEQDQQVWYYPDDWAGSLMYDPANTPAWSAFTPESGDETYDFVWIPGDEYEGQQIIIWDPWSWSDGTGDDGTGDDGTGDDGTGDDGTGDDGTGDDGTGDDGTGDDGTGDDGTGDDGTGSDDDTAGGNDIDPSEYGDLIPSPTLYYVRAEWDSSTTSSIAEWHEMTYTSRESWVTEGMPANYQYTVNYEMDVEALGDNWGDNVVVWRYGTLGYILSMTTAAFEDVGGVQYCNGWWGQTKAYYLGAIGLIHGAGLTGVCFQHTNEVTGAVTFTLARNPFEDTGIPFPQVVAGPWALDETLWTAIGELQAIRSVLEGEETTTDDSTIESELGGYDWTNAATEMGDGMEGLTAERSWGPPAGDDGVVNWTAQAGEVPFFGEETGDGDWGVWDFPGMPEGFSVGLILPEEDSPVYDVTVHVFHLIRVLLLAFLSWRFVNALYRLHYTW